jgi:hypothetical protein
MSTEKNTNSPAQIAKLEQFSFFNPAQFATMQRVASMFSTSDLVPNMYQADKVGKEKATANCVIAINMANRIEADVLMIMQNLVIIYGKPSWSSKFLISTVNTCGRFKPLKFKFEDLGELKKYQYQEYETTWENNKKKSKVVNKTLEGPIKNLQCIAYTTEKGSDDVLEGSPVSVELAINEGWYTKKGSKWPNMTQQMLMYRAASFWTSAYAPELSMGMKTEDEVRDIVDITYEDVTEDQKLKQEIQNNANKEELTIDDEQAPEDEKKPEPEPQPEKKTKQFKADF